MAFNYLIPMLEVENMNETIAFYESTLDFKCVGRDGNSWAVIQKDDISVMFSARFNKEEYPHTMLTGSLYIYTDDIDVIWQILKDKVTICYPIENFAYGMREFAIFDCNGYRIQFGQELDKN
ncbi:MAG: VOC family protein [Bacteroidia bacterium]|nr:VOC family protein [Bacteroidia bacterium]NND25018.1 bleomycin resistance family protein [Flavobacteriaceae bacterium]MBT8278562.1 VOC family protein [Bacteroidia bacterium]NNK59544.1 bleomycin resistance family protein [Flavobacteriaceae bacterium]NNL32491.1 bleomycin resistance family protein [Flavobacteriaceae bacterium]